MKNTPPLRIVFFGSFQDYSALVLKELIKANEIEVVAVVTTPPANSRKNQPPQPNPVQTLAAAESIPVFTPQQLDSDSLAALVQLAGSPHLVVTAGYGKLLPNEWLTLPHFGSLNLHFSLLPKYRGANPAEWAILMGETQTGVSVIEMNADFDQGGIVAQAQIAMAQDETRLSLYQKLYKLGGQVLPSVLVEYAKYKQPSQFSKLESLSQSKLKNLSLFLPPHPQPEISPTPTAYRFFRDDGFVEWTAIKDVMSGKPTSLEYLCAKLKKGFNLAHPQLETYHLPSQIAAQFITTATRALLGYPGLWTTIETHKGPKKVKILQTKVNQDKLELVQIQIEGQQPTQWNQVKNFLTSIT